MYVRSALESLIVLVIVRESSASAEPRLSAIRLLGGRNTGSL